MWSPGNLVSEEIENELYGSLSQNSDILKDGIDVEVPPRKRPMLLNVNEKVRVQKIFEDTTNESLTPKAKLSANKKGGSSNDESLSAHDPFSHDDGQYGSDSDYHPDKDKPSPRKTIPVFIQTFNGKLEPISPKKTMPSSSSRKKSGKNSSIRRRRLLTPNMEQDSRGPSSPIRQRPATLKIEQEELETNNPYCFEVSTMEHEDSETKNLNYLLTLGEQEIDTANATSSQHSPSLDMLPFTIEVDVPNIGREISIGRRKKPIRAAKKKLNRGQPLVHKYVDDSELPENIRENIAQLISYTNCRNATGVTQEGEKEHDSMMSLLEEEDLLEFEWRGMDDWQGMKETFLSEYSGSTRIFNNAYDAFRAIWDDIILSQIVTRTNLHAQTIQDENFRRDWFETNLHEILILFAFWMMLGIIKMPTVKSCFSGIPLMQTHVFGFLFEETRYWNVNKAFHLSDSTSDVVDVLHPMGPVLDHLNCKFKSLYYLQQDICIHESIIPWKTEARCGIKTLQLCESATGYLWSFLVYVGKESKYPNVSTNFSNVAKLIQPLLNLGHVLYMDKFNSPLLARFLKRRKTDSVGTLCTSRVKTPYSVHKAELAEGEFTARHSGDVMTVSIQENSRTTYISTFHNVTQVQKETEPGQPVQYKLKLVEDYNHGMGTVDHFEHMLEAYLVERKQCTKWSMKLFKRLLNKSIQNARILMERSTNKNIDSLAFRLALVQSIINKHHHLVPKPTSPNNSQSQATQEAQEDLPPDSTDHRSTRSCVQPVQHFIRRIEITKEMRKNAAPGKIVGREPCVWCSTRGNKQENQTVYECDTCKLPLCLEDCFKQYHTKT